MISIEEALPRSIDGYAATTSPTKARIQIAYTADDTVAIHELAHLWFDGSLFADRWIDDGFAIFYGNRVARTLKLSPAGRVDHAGPGCRRAAAQRLVRDDADHDRDGRRARPRARCRLTSPTATAGRPP